MASRAEPAEAAPDRYRAVVAQAIRLGATMADRIRLDALLKTLVALGIPSSDARIPLWAAAAICRTADERRRFLADPDAVVAPEPAPPAPNLPEPKISRWALRRWLAIAAIAAFGLAALSLMWLAQPPPADCSVTGTCPQIVNRQLRTHQVPVLKQVAEPTPTWGIAALAIPPLCLLLWRLWLRRRRQRALGRPEPLPRHGAPADPAGELPDLFSGTRGVFRRLGRHEFAPGTSINIRDTIAATVRAGGLPSFRFGRRRRTPEYLFLSERASASDHMPLAARLLRDRMAREQLPVRHYEFFGEPLQLHRVDRARQGAPQPLSTLLASFPDAHILLMMEGYDIAGVDKPPAWLTALTENRSVFHLNPRRPLLWGSAEQQLAREGLATHHIGDAGLIALGEPRLGSHRARTGDGTSALWDLPESYAPHRRAVLASELLPSLSPAAVIADLYRWLDQGEAHWLAALALYPVITPRLTIALGRHLTDAAGRPLLTEARLIELARLPWLRAGYMPDWLRGPLARTLPPHVLRQALPVLQAMLLDQRGADNESLDPDEGIDQKKRADLIEWLAACPESELHDRLLLDALKQKQPLALGRERLAFLPVPLRHALASRRIREGIATAAILAAILVFIPPVAEEPGKQSETILEDRTEIAPDPVVPPDATRPPASMSSPATAEASNASGASTPGPTPLPAAVPKSPAPSEATTTGRPPQGPQVGDPYIVFFDWDKSVITAEAASILDNLVARYSALSDVPAAEAITVRIECYSDGEFGEAYALRISQRRCQSVQDYLSSRSAGIQFYTIAKGLEGKAYQSLIIAGQGVRQPQARRAELAMYRSAAAPAAPPALNPKSQSQSSKGAVATGAQQYAPAATPKPALNQGDATPLTAETGSLDDRSDKSYDQGDFAAALSLNTQSCELKSNRGCFWNGYLYEAGKGVTRDPVEALKWYAQACDLGLQQGCDAAKRLRRAQGAQAR